MEKKCIKNLRFQKMPWSQKKVKNSRFLRITEIAVSGGYHFYYSNPAPIAINPEYYRNFRKKTWRIN